MPQVFDTELTYSRCVEEIAPVGLGPKCEIWENAQVDPYGYIFCNGCIAPENFADQYESRRWQYLSTIPQTQWRKKIWYWARNHFYYKKDNIKDPYIAFTDSFSEGYYHWLLETLPRLMYAHKNYPQLGYLIPQRLLYLPYIRQTLELFFPKIPYITTKSRHLLRFKQITFSHRVTKLNHFVPSLMHEFRNYVRARIPKTKRRLTKRLFVSRSNLKNKRLVNEDMLETVLNSYGFEKIYFDQMSILEQVQACQNCEYLAGPHGAGLANALFLPDGAQLLEIQTHSIQATCYKRLTAALKIPYHALFVPDFFNSYTKHTNASAHFTSFQVDPSQLESQFLSMGIKKVC